MSYVGLKSGACQKALEIGQSDRVVDGLHRIREAVKCHQEKAQSRSLDVWLPNQS